MKALNRDTVTANKYTERIIQFGEGNFLRAFADWMIHEMNSKASFDSGVVVVQPLNSGLVDVLNEQDGLYTLYLNGIVNGKAVSNHQLIDSIQRGINPYTNYGDYLVTAQNPNLRFVISNTTEAGIAYVAGDKLDDAPQKSFPGKLTALLYKRFQCFNGAANKGLIIIPCELIDRNGDNLKGIVLRYATDWGLGEGFKSWIEETNIFCNTLVDRIVPGYPKDKMGAITQEIGYKDQLVVEAEQFHLWVIEAPKSVGEEFPAEVSGLNIVFTDNMEPYRTRKVRILNGAHTTLVPVAYLYGIDRVREAIEDKLVGNFLKDALFNNICPTLDLPGEELIKFSSDVLDRFKNPYLEHELMSISLNSVSKFNTRVLPSVIEYIRRKNEFPHYLLFALSALIAFYKGERNGHDIVLNDDLSVLEFFKKTWRDNSPKDVAAKVLSNTDFWGTDLTMIEGLEKEVTEYLDSILKNGMKAALTAFMRKSSAV